MTLGEGWNGTVADCRASRRPVSNRTRRYRQIRERERAKEWGRTWHVVSLLARPSPSHFLAFTTTVTNISISTANRVTSSFSSFKFIFVENLNLLIYTIVSLQLYFLFNIHRIMLRNIKNLIYNIYVRNIIRNIDNSTKM